MRRSQKRFHVPDLSSTGATFRAGRAKPGRYVEDSFRDVDFDYNPMFGAMQERLLPAHLERIP